LNTNHDPKNGEFTFGAGGHAEKATFHREQQAKHLKRASAARRAWIKIRANKEAKKAAAPAAKAAAEKAKAEAIQAGLNAKASAAGHRVDQGARIQSAAAHRAAAADHLAKAKQASEAAKDHAANAALASHAGHRADEIAGVKSEAAAGSLDPAIKAREDSLRSPVAGLRNLGGGVSVTKKADLANGKKAVFKPAAGEPSDGLRSGIIPGMATECEVGAWEVAKRVGMHDMVAPTIEVNVKGQRGAMMEWQNGDQAANAANRYDGKIGAARAAAFDYVIGNTDRHGGNWIVESSPAGAKLHLIDHGLSFPEADKLPYGNKQFINNAVHDGAMKPPSNYAARYVSAKPKILAALTGLGLPSKAVSGVGFRIDTLAKANAWGDLK
jgi:hypothetical protein